MKPRFCNIASLASLFLLLALCLSLSCDARTAFIGSWNGTSFHPNFTSSSSSSLPWSSSLCIVVLDQSIATTTVKALTEQLTHWNGTAVTNSNNNSSALCPVDRNDIVVLSRVDAVHGWSPDVALQYLLYHVLNRTSSTSPFTSVTESRRLLAEWYQNVSVWLFAQDSPVPQQWASLLFQNRTGGSEGLPQIADPLLVVAPVSLGSSRWLRGAPAFCSLSNETAAASSSLSTCFGRIALLDLDRVDLGATAATQAAAGLLPHTSCPKRPLLLQIVITNTSCNSSLRTTSGFLAGFRASANCDASNETVCVAVRLSISAPNTSRTDTGGALPIASGTAEDQALRELSKALATLFTNETVEDGLYSITRLPSSREELLWDSAFADWKAQDDHTTPFLGDAPLLSLIGQLCQETLHVSVYLSPSDNAYAFSARDSASAASQQLSAVCAAYRNRSNLTAAGSSPSPCTTRRVVGVEDYVLQVDLLNGTVEDSSSMQWVMQREFLLNTSSSWIGSLDALKQHIVSLWRSSSNRDPKTQSLPILPRTLVPRTVSSGPASTVRESYLAPLRTDGTFRPLSNCSWVREPPGWRWSKLPTNNVAVGRLLLSVDPDFSRMQVYQPDLNLLIVKRLISVKPELLRSRLVSFPLYGSLDHVVYGFGGYHTNSTAIVRETPMHTRYLVLRMNPAQDRILSWNDDWLDISLHSAGGVYSLVGQCVATFRGCIYIHGGTTLDGQPNGNLYRFCEPNAVDFVDDRTSPSPPRQWVLVHADGPTLFQHSCVAIDRPTLNAGEENAVFIAYGGTQSGEPSSVAYLFSFRTMQWSVLMTGLQRPLVGGCFLYDSSSSRFLQFGGLLGSRIFTTLSLFSQSYIFVPPKIGIFGASSSTSCVEVAPRAEGEPRLVLSSSNGETDGMIHRIALRASSCSLAENQVPSALGDYCVPCPNGMVADGDTCRNCGDAMLTINAFYTEICGTAGVDEEDVLVLILVTPIAIGAAIVLVAVVYGWCCMGATSGGGPSFRRVANAPLNNQHCAFFAFALDNAPQKWSHRPRQMTVATDHFVQEVRRLVAESKAFELRQFGDLGCVSCNDPQRLFVLAMQLVYFVEYESWPHGLGGLSLRVLLDYAVLERHANGLELDVGGPALDRAKRSIISSRCCRGVHATEAFCAQVLPLLASKGSIEMNGHPPMEYHLTVPSDSQRSEQSQQQVQADAALTFSGQQSDPALLPLATSSRTPGTRKEELPPIEIRPFTWTALLEERNALRAVMCVITFASPRSGSLSASMASQSDTSSSKNDSSRICAIHEEAAEAHPLVTMEVLSKFEFVQLASIVSKLYMSMLSPLTDDEKVTVEKAMAEHLRLFADSAPNTKQRYNDVAVRALQVVDMLQIKEIAHDLETAAAQHLCA